MIESIILENPTLGEKLSINMDSGPLWLESFEVGPVESNPHTYNFPGQDGVSLESITLGTRPVTIIGWIVEDLSGRFIQRMKAKLNRFCNPRQELKAIYKGYSLDFNPDSSIFYSKDPGENNEVMCKFMIQGTALSPFWVLNPPIKTPISRVRPNLILPISFPEKGRPLGMIQSSTSTIITNDSLPVGCKIRFTPQGRVVNPGIVCLETQERFTIDKVLENLEEIEVNTQIGHRSIKGIVGGKSLNYMKFLRMGSTWISLRSGINTLMFFADEGQDLLSISIEYSPLFLEVEDQ